MKKIVIWGHKLGTHTHSYVHYGYWRAAEYIGYAVEWYDDNDDVSSVDFSDTIFITEHNVCKNMPIRNDCVYFNHNIDRPFDNTNRSDITHPRYFNFVYFADRWNPADNITWPDNNELQYIDLHHYFHSKTNTLTTMWATDLLSDEIDQVEPELFDESKDSIYFVGTPNGSNINKFMEICSKNGKPFKLVGGWSGLYANSAPDINQNIQLVRDSYISVDIRDAPHLVQGRYYPCRLFKNISYGKWTGSNHPEIADVFGDHFTTDSNLDNLYEKLVEDSRNCTEQKMRSAMNFIRDGHTYASRLKNFLKIIE